MSKITDMTDDKTKEIYRSFRSNIDLNDLSVAQIVVAFAEYYLQSQLSQIREEVENNISRIERIASQSSLSNNWPEAMRQRAIVDTYKEILTLIDKQSETGKHAQHIVF